tara:strand:+ start:2233 stop:3072 length:840 start_codon:yes stop_codon:yes gene_type:complete
MCFKNKSVLLLLFFFGCTPQKIIVNNPELVSRYYFERKIKSYEKKEDLTKDEKRELIKLQIQYAFGFILERSDRIINDDYHSGINLAKKAHPYFRNSIDLSLSNLKEIYPEIENWLVSKKDGINFKKGDVFDLYWLAAGYGGSVKSSRGNPYEMMNINKIEKILYKALELDPDWNYGSIYSAMMSYMISRPDLYGQALQDSIDKYYFLSLDATDSLDASIFVSYAEGVDVKNQNKPDFISRLKLAKTIKTNNNQFQIQNLLAQNRADWLISRKEEYFFE